MIPKVFVASIAILMVTDLVAAGQNVPVKTNWTGFREQVTQQRLTNRNVWIVLASGGEIKVRLIRLEENGLTVRSKPATKQ